MATFKSAAVEEFYNRVHSPADGRFATSGTGGGHYKGRAAGKAAPKGSGGSSKAPPPPPAKSSGSPFPKPTAGVKPNAPRSLNEYKKKAPNSDKPKGFVIKDKSNDKGIIGKGVDKSNDKGIIAKGVDRSNDKGFGVVGKDKSNDKGFGVTPKSKFSDKGFAAPPAKKIKLSDRLKNVGRFAKKLGEGVMKDNMTTSEYNTYKKSHDPKFKGERLNVRNTFLTGRQQRN